MASVQIQNLVCIVAHGNGFVCVIPLLVAPIASPHLQARSQGHWEAVITLKIFGDESSDESSQRVFALSALVGTDGEWEPAVAEWVGLLGGIEFHANEFETEFVKDADRTKHIKRQGEYAALVQVLVKSHLAGFAVALDLQSFRELFHDEFEIGYYKCFSDILAIVAPLAREWNARVAADPGCGDDYLRPELTFDRRQGQGTIVTLYDTFMEQPEWRDSDILASKMSFDTRKNPRIQMADLIARESMKEMDRLVTKRSDVPRKSKTALDSIPKKFNFIQRDRAYLANWRNQQTELEQSVGFDRAEYVAWLLDTNRVFHDGAPADNLRNRLMYLAYLDNRAAIDGKKKK